MMAQLGAVEEEIYQVRNQSGQDPLNYPIKLNNQIAALAGVVGGAEARPTKQSYEVFTILSDALAVQTGKLGAALDQPLPALNRELERQGLPAIVPEHGPGEAVNRPSPRTGRPRAGRVWRRASRRSGPRPPSPCRRTRC